MPILNGETLKGYLDADDSTYLKFVRDEKSIGIGAEDEAHTRILYSSGMKMQFIRDAGCVSIYPNAHKIKVDFSSRSLNVGEDPVKRFETINILQALVNSLAGDYSSFEVIGEEDL